MPFRRTEGTRPDPGQIVADSSSDRSGELLDTGLRDAELPQSELPEADPSQAEPAPVQVSVEPGDDAEASRSLVSRVVGADVDERSACIAEDGDDSVAKQLRDLDPRWHSLHAVRPGERGEDVDDVVVGPGGVFTINAKDLGDATVWVSGGTFVVDGERTPFVRNNRSAARRTSELLSAATKIDVEVDAIISVGGAQGGFVVAAQPEHGRVHVVPRMRLASFLASRPEVLDTEQIERIFAAGRRLATWKPAVAHKVLLSLR